MTPATTPLQPLHDLLGTWVGQERLASGIVATTVAVTRLDLQGQFLVSDHLQRQPDSTQYHNLLLYGWDAAQNAFTLFQFDSQGRAPAGPTFGQRLGNHIIFSRSTPAGELRYMYLFDGDARYHFHFERSHDGATWEMLVDGDFRRA